MKGPTPTACEISAGGRVRIRRDKPQPVISTPRAQPGRAVLTFTPAPARLRSLSLCPGQNHLRIWTLHTEPLLLPSHPSEQYDNLFPSGMHAKLFQSYPTVCDPMGCSLPGSSIHGIPQARILEWVAMPSSKGSSWPRDRTHVFWVSCIGRWVFWFFFFKPLALPGKSNPFPRSTEKLKSTVVFLLFRSNWKKKQKPRKAAADKSVPPWPPLFHPPPCKEAPTH